MASISACPFCDPFAEFGLSPPPSPPPPSPPPLGILFLPMRDLLPLSFASHTRSFAVSRMSAVAKYLVAFAEGLPRGLSRRAWIKAGMSWGWQFNTQPACSAESRRGSCPKSAKNRCCSSFMQNQSQTELENERLISNNPLPVEILVLGAKLLEEFRSQNRLQKCEPALLKSIYLWQMEGFLRAYVYSRVKPSAMEDVLQLIAIGIVKGLQKCRAKTEQGIRIWYCTIARNKVNDYLRKKFSDRLDFLPLDDLTYVLNGSAFYSSSWDVRHDLDVVMKALKQLKPQCCKLLWSFYVV